MKEVRLVHSRSLEHADSAGGPPIVRAIRSLLFHNLIRKPVSRQRFPSALMQPRARGHHGWALCMAAEMSTIYSRNADAAYSCRFWDLRVLHWSTPSISISRRNNKQAQRTRQLVSCNQVFWHLQLLWVKWPRPLPKFRLDPPR
jgi:hypothetical protein